MANEQMKKEIQEKLAIGLKHGEGKVFLEKLATKYNIPYQTAATTFYTIKKQQVSLKPVGKETSTKFEKEVSLTNDYHLGQELTFIVKGLFSHSVIGETKDKIKVILHIKDIKKEIDVQIHHHFHTQDEVRGKVIMITPKELHVSTIGYELPNYHTPERRNEITDIENYLKPIIGGSLSDAAKKELQTMIQEKGLFEVSLALAKVSPTFHVDMGLLLLNKIKKDWSDDL